MTTRAPRARIGWGYAFTFASACLTTFAIAALSFWFLRVDWNSSIKAEGIELIEDATLTAQLLDSTLAIADHTLDSVRRDFLRPRPAAMEQHDIRSAAFQMNGVQNAYLLGEDGGMLGSAFSRIASVFSLDQSGLDQLRNGADSVCRILDVPPEGGKVLVLLKVLRREHPSRFCAVVFPPIAVRERILAQFHRDEWALGLSDNSGGSLFQGSAAILVGSPAISTKASWTLSGWPITLSYRISRAAQRHIWITSNLALAGIIAAVLCLNIFLLVYGATLSRRASRTDELTRTAMRLSEEVEKLRLAVLAREASEERYRFSLEVTSQVGWATLPDGCVEDMPLWRKYTGQSVEDVRGWKWLDALHADDRASAFAAWSAAIAQKTKYETEYRIRRADGVYRNFLARGVALLHADGSIREWVGTCIDITEHKEAESALRSSLEEKTTLLQEIHHRVKNNLQIVASLLNLQANRVGSVEVAGALHSVEGRILSMALLHEALYRSDNLARIDFSAYAIQLCDQLLFSFGSSSERVALAYRMEGMELSMDQALPCGLIINELMSNALKHAFPGERAGTIFVDYVLADDGLASLRIADDGVGLPADIEVAAAPTLGLRLVSKLALQLGGRIEMEKTARGTSTLVTFPIDTDRRVGSTQ